MNYQRLYSLAQNMCILCLNWHSLGTVVRSEVWVMPIGSMSETGTGVVAFLALIYK